MCMHACCSCAGVGSGDAYGQGRVREKELVGACSALGVTPDHVTVIDDPQVRTTLGVARVPP